MSYLSRIIADWCGFVAVMRFSGWAALPVRVAFCPGFPAWLPCLFFRLIFCSYSHPSYRLIMLRSVPFYLTAATAAMVSACICVTAVHAKQPVAQRSTALPAPIASAIQRAGLPASAVSIVVQQVGLDDSAARAAEAARQAQWERTRLRANTGLHKGVYSTELQLPGAGATAAPTPVPLPSPTPHAPLVNHQADVQRNPASVMKLITTYAALDTLGVDFRWYNRIYHTGSVRNGVLNGDLIIRGSGDPKLVLERISALFSAIQKKGIRHVKGDIILDRSVFQTIRKNPASFDGQPLRAYNATPDGLLLNFKSIIFTFDPDVPAQEQAISRSTAQTAAGGQTVSLPRQPRLTVRNGQGGTAAKQRVNLSAGQRKKTAGSRQGNYIAVQYEPPIANVSISSQVRLRKTNRCGNWKGSLRANFKNAANLQFNGSFPSGCGLRYWPVAYPDTDTYAPRVVAAMWKKAGGTVTGKVRYGIRPKKSRMLLRKPSLPMQTIITDINQYSNNIMADQVFLSLPVYSKDQPAVYTGSYAQSRKWLKNWWQHTLPGIEQPSYVENGSGLSRRTRVSADTLSQLLQHAASHTAAEPFVQSMGVAGVSGTIAKLKNRDPDSAAIGKAFIKTGTLNGVRAIGGYVDGQSGKRYTVVGMINHRYAGRSKPVLDALLDWTARQ